MYLGIDIGTSCVKAVLIDDAGALADQATAPLPISRPHPLWSEQNPTDWWDATCRAVASLDPQKRARVRAVGLAGQMHGATLLGADGVPLRPAILWNDGRSGPQCEALEARVPMLPEITGNRAMPGFTAPKLEWVRTHEPAIFDQTTLVLLPKDYVRLCMTGDAASDMSDSAGTLWMDVDARDWSDTMLAATGLTRAQMPTLFEGDAVTEQLRAEVAQAWGMARVPVVAGGGDNAAGAIGVGVVDAGQAFLSLGTSGVLFLANDAYRPNPAGGVHSFCHALPGRWHQMSVILSAAACADWAARTCGVADAAALFALVEARNAPAATEMFLPYLSGERTPHNDPAAQGVLFGLTHESDAATIGQAVLEGVAFAFRDGLDALIDSGAAIDSITVIGGGARSAHWGRILSAALDRPLTYCDGGEIGPAFGAARLARLGIERGSVQDICPPPQILNVTEPDAALVDRFAGRQPLFRALYRQLKPSFLENAA
jgi:xylulokinase